VPSDIHEGLVEMFRHRPLFAAELLSRTLGVSLPSFQEARLDSGDLTQLVPTEYRADAVVLLTVRTTSVMAVVVEVQLGRDRRKRWSWPVYLTTLRARLRCPTVLLVICATGPIAKWCSTPIDVGHPGLVLRPLVLGPSGVPVVTEHDQAFQEPELAVLSAMAHGAGPRRNDVLSALLKAYEAVDSEHRLLYHDVVIAALPEAARLSLEALMTTETYRYQSDFARGYFSKGEARMVLAVLEARGIAVGGDTYVRITTCSDLDQLETWGRRAATADRIEDLFD
jgi:hypothetical protein